MTALVACAVVTLAVPAVAYAGRRHFAWSYDTETLPERGVEIETWVTERVAADPETTVEWLVTVGLHDQIELALPVEIAFDGDTTRLTWIGIDARFRLVTADPMTAPKVVPLIRVGVERLVSDPGVNGSLDFVLSWDVWRLHLVGDVGVAVDSPGPVLDLNFGVGAALRVSEFLHLGVEAFGKATLAAPMPENPWVAIGPTLAFTHGRFWVTANALFGVTTPGPEFLARLLWGVLF